MSDHNVIDRREAILRVTAMLGGVTLIGGSSLLAACEKRSAPPDTASSKIGDFTPEDIALLDEVADTILPETKTPGAKAAKTGAFMALMVTDTYEPSQQQVFRDGMRKLNEASQKANSATFMASTPQQRLSLLTALDKEAKSYADAVDAARRRASEQGKPGPAKTAEAKKAEQHLPDQRKEAALGSDVGAATAITADSPPHYFRMMKELTMLGYFTSEIGCTQALRYVESPGRYDPCVPYTKGEKAWAPHA